MDVVSHGAAGPAMGRAGWAMLLALAVLWGGSFFFNGVAVRELRCKAEWAQENKARL